MPKTHWKKALGYSSINSMPEKAGVYGFWSTKGRCIYIGKAERQTIRTRVMQEWKNSHNAKLKMWIKHFGKHLEICYNDTTHSPDRLETRLIRLFNPETNVRKQRRQP